MSKEIEDLKARLLKYSKQNGDCLESTYKSQTRYAHAKFRGRLIGAHRASWIAHKGEIPEGMWVLHLCDNPICINPDHLFLGTAQDNTNDMITKKRENFRGNKLYSSEMSDKAVQMRAEGMIYRDIAAELGVRIGTITTFFKRTEHKEKVKEFYNVPRYPKEIRDKAWELYGYGLRCKKIQEILSIPKRSLTRILNEYRETSHD